MNTIKLTQGKFAIIDDSDFEWLSQWKWYYHHGYAVRSLYLGGGRKNQKRQTLPMHRFINNTSKGFDTDHINRDKLDNRRSNLRTVTTIENQRNTNTRKDNKSGYKGVTWNKQRNKWHVSIRVDTKLIFLGLYSNLQEASLVRKQGEGVYF